MKNLVKLLVMFAIGIAAGFLLVSAGMVLLGDKSWSDIGGKLHHIDGGLMLWTALKSFVCLILAAYLQIILHEGGHLLFGWLTGYRFVSFRILSFTIIQEEGKLCIKQFDVAGTGGQCLLAPPDKPAEQTPVAWYNIGGVLMNLLASGIALTLCMTVGGFFWLSLLIFGLFFALLNGIPMKISGIGNDAYNQLLLRRNPQSKTALLMQLRINAQLQEGCRPKELPETWFSYEEPDYQDSLQVGYYLMTISRWQDSGEWDKVYQALTQALKHEADMIAIFWKELRCELLYTDLVLGKTEEARHLYTDDLKSYIQQYKRFSSAKQRQLAAIALYLEQDKEKARRIYDEVCQKQSDYLMQGEVKMDIALMKTNLEL